MRIIFVLLVMSILAPAPEAQAGDPAEVASLVLPVVERTIQKLESHRKRFLSREINSQEFSWLSVGELDRFEVSALSIYHQNYFGAKETLKAYAKDPLIRDLKYLFSQFSKGNLSQQVLVRELVHENQAVRRFLIDPSLGYASFSGFYR